MTPYRAPFWLPGGHLQTIWPLLRKPPLPPYRRERVASPDGDFVDLDWVDGPPDAPLLLLFHGLEGSSHSHYARSLMAAVQAASWRGVVAHFRGCSGENNRLLRAYHAGDSSEIHWLLHLAGQRAGGAPLHAAGVSLGGNALLKWLGESGQAATQILCSTVAICPPLDMNICGHALGRGFNRIYSQHFLGTLKHKALLKAQRFPGELDEQRIRCSRSLFEFDDAYTAPAHGFKGARDYWQQASSRPWLTAIRVPTLLLTSANDSFVPPAALPTPGEYSTEVRHEHLPGGGHVGFVSGSFPGQLGWCARRILQHCTQQD